MKPYLEKIGDLLRDHIGLSVESVGETALEHAVRARMKSVGVPLIEDYRPWLNRPEELQALVEAITVPETWFFRQHQAFTALVDFALLNWKPDSSEQKFRVLSAPCSTGEEAYSVVMALLDAGFPVERLSVDGLDVSGHCIRLAQKGLYRAYAFRSPDLSFRERHFAEMENGFQLESHIRSHVRFFKGNVLRLDALPLSPNYDVIFCRNLLIYLDEASRQSVINELAARLEPQGLLFTSAAEAPFFTKADFYSIGLSGSGGFRRGERRDLKPIGSRAAPAKSHGARENQSFLRASLERKELGAATPSLAIKKGESFALTEEASHQLSVEGLLAKAAVLADSGQLDEAQMLCERYRQTQGETVPVLYLLALICDSRGEKDAAEKFYRRVLYLEAEHLEALLHLAMLLSLKGEVTQAQQLRERARRINNRQQLKANRT